jgi:2-dehydropantoate 2-reductase
MADPHNSESVQYIRIESVSSTRTPGMAAVDVIGAGGIGCSVGLALLRAGHTVRFIETNHAKIDQGNRHGVEVIDVGRHDAPFVHFDDWQPTPARQIWLCTKCYDNAAVLKRLPTGAKLVPVQNGFDAGLQTTTLAGEGIASFVAACEPDAPYVRITRPGELHIAGVPITSFTSDKLFRVVAVRSILPYKHTKLMYNAAISPLAAAAGLDTGSLLSMPLAHC